MSQNGLDSAREEAELPLLEPVPPGPNNLQPAPGIRIDGQPIDTNAIFQSLEQGKFFLIFVAIFIIKFIADNLVCFLFSAAIAMIFARIDESLSALFVMKSAATPIHALTVLFRCVMSCFSIVVLSNLIFQDPSFITHRLSLSPSIQSKFGFMEIVWRILFADFLARTLVLMVKLILFSVMYVNLSWKSIYRSLLCSSRIIASSSNTLGGVYPSSRDLEAGRANRSVPPISNSSQSGRLNSASDLSPFLSGRLNFTSDVITSYFMSNTSGGGGGGSTSSSGASSSGSSSGNGSDASSSNLSHRRSSNVSPYSDISGAGTGAGAGGGAEHALSAGEGGRDIGSTNSSDNEEEDVRAESAKFLLFRRWELCVDVLGWLWRTLLPVPLWFVYLHRDSPFTSSWLPGLYVACKLYDMYWKAGALTEAIGHLRSGNLEFGRYSTPAEVSACQDCPVCFEPPTSPVTLTCNHVFCECCILEWLEREKTCPVCRTEVAASSKFLGPLKAQKLTTIVL